MDKLFLLGVVMLLELLTGYEVGCASDECSAQNTKAPEGYDFDDCEEHTNCGPSSFFLIDSSRCCECPDHTFMAKYNRCGYCRPYTECGPNEEVESKGTFNSDVKCRCRSFPIPLEECIKINCTVFPPNMTNGIPDSGQPSNTSEPDMKTCQPYKSEQCDGNWPTGAIIVIVCLICIIIILIIIICYNKKWCCFKKNVTAENTTPNVGAESADTRTHHNDKTETQV